MARSNTRFRISATLGLAAWLAGMGAFLRATDAQLTTDWFRTYNGIASHTDYAWDIDVDARGNVAVTGQSETPRGYDFVTIRYDADGNEQWVRSFDGLGEYNDVAWYVEMDGAGNVYVAGDSWSGLWWDIVLLKYDPAGNELWRRWYDGGFDNYAFGLEVTSDGSVYLTGWNWDHDADGRLTPKLLTAKLDTDGNLLWDRISSGAEDYGAWSEAMFVDDDENVYVTGVVSTSPAWGSRDLFTAKYDSVGNLLWQRQWAPPGGDASNSHWALDVTVDARGNVFVVGRIAMPHPLYDEGVILKYDSTGTLLWERFDSQDDANFYQKVVADEAGNAYVLGVFNNDDFPVNADNRVAAYDPNGNLLWIQDYAGSNGNYDGDGRIALDPNGNVVAAIEGVDVITGSDVVLLRYDAATGAVLSQDLVDFGPEGFGNEFPRGLAIDAIGNIYIAGGAGLDQITFYNYLTVKLFSPDASAISLCQGIDDENVLSINGDDGIVGGHEVAVSVDGPIRFDITLPSGGGNGKFLVHLNVDSPDALTITALPAQLGDFCFPVFLPPRGEASPASIWNNIGKVTKIGESNYFGTPIEIPDRAPVTFLDLPAGDAKHFPVGSTFTLQGTIVNPASSSSKGASVTNAILSVVL